MSVSDDPPHDPFDGLDLDEEWARGASVREPSAEARFQEADRFRLQQETAERGRRTVRRRRRRRRALVVLGFAAFVAAIAIADQDGGSSATTWTSGGDEPEILTVDERPPAQAATTRDPLGEPADPDAEGGSYGFLQLQPGGNEPVAYDPCRPITIVVNDRTAPDGAAELLQDAVATISEVSGLSMEIEGDTDEAPRFGRPAYQPDRYGQQWAPVLVAWTDDEEIPDLADDVAGLGGSVAVAPERGPLTYVTGIVYLDGPDIEAIIDEEDQGDRSARDIVLHELGHLVGLAHVDDPSELMYPDGQPDLHNLQQGDQTGLTKLGQGACAARL